MGGDLALETQRLREVVHDVGFSFASGTPCD
jgi:hypothetical protein